jgi:predicted transcriptional regulator
MKILIKGKKTPTELAREIGLSVKTISETLRNLRQIDLVRYDTRANSKVYFLKDPSMVRILKDLEAYVQMMRVRRK